jgi:hypothetical protein
MVVDAFLNDDSVKTQIVKLRFTQPYFDNSPPPALTGAEVYIETTIPAFPPFILHDTTRTIKFTEVGSTGDYTWKPNAGNLFTSRLTLPGMLHKLIIKTNGERYEAISFADDALKVDSIWTRDARAVLDGKDTTEKAGYKLRMKIPDIAGRPNFTWFRTYRNGKRIGIADAVTAYDAAFGPGTDGTDVIPPIVGNMSPNNFYVGDTITIETRSMDQFGYLFFNLALQQIQNSGLFASPPNNTPSNVINITHKDSKEPKYKALGCFQVGVSKYKTYIIKK